MLLSIYSSIATQHSEAQRNHPCTKQQAKYVPIECVSKDVHTCIRRPGCFPGACSSWHLQVICLHPKCWTIYCICHSVPFFLVNERSGRNRPLREAPCSTYCAIGCFLNAALRCALSTASCMDLQYWPIRCSSNRSGRRPRSKTPIYNASWGCTCCLSNWRFRLLKLSRWWFTYDVTDSMGL